MGVPVGVKWVKTVKNADFPHIYFPSIGGPFFETQTIAALNHWRPCSCHRWSTCLQLSSSRSVPIPDIFYFEKHSWSHICSTYPSLQFGCITDYFLYRALEATCAASPLSKFVIIPLHYIKLLLLLWKPCRWFCASLKVKVKIWTLVIAPLTWIRE